MPRRRVYSSNLFPPVVFDGIVGPWPRLLLIAVTCADLLWAAGRPGFDLIGAVLAVASAFAWMPSLVQSFLYRDWRLKVLALWFLVSVGAANRFFVPEGNIPSRACGAIAMLLAIFWSAFGHRHVDRFIGPQAQRARTGSRGKRTPDQLP